MAVMTYIEAIRSTLQLEMRRDETIIVLGEDVGKKGGVFLATDGLFDEFGSERVLDTPLSESMIIGASIGAALNGLRPVPEIQFADFIMPAFNQIVSEAARMRYRSNGTFTCPMTIRAPYGGGVHGALYHSQSVEAFFAHVPGLKVVIPSTPYDARGLLRSSIRDEDPVLFFEHKKMYRSVRGEVPDSDYSIPLGEAKVVREGSQISIIGYGLMVQYALEAAELLEGDDISVEVVDIRTLRPLDGETILESVRKTGKAVVVYEDNRFGGYGAEIAAIIAEEAFDHLDGPVMRVTGPDVPGVPYAHTLEDWFMPNPDRIADAVRRLAAY
ncbi:MAG: alpha-ketoacid dehydrogenase subunit beta [Chloroflexota bacterium]|nr:alpha-ketoacid dehydrogenase subunit beta [Chloroflexota bacterium]